MFISFVTTKRKNRHLRPQTPHAQWCLVCFKSLNKVNTLSELFHDDVLCQQCRRNLTIKPVKISFDDFVLYSLYPYTSAFQKLLIQYKDLYDEALYPIFLYPYKAQLIKFFSNKNIIAIPSHPNHHKQRGFNHVKRLFTEICETYPSPILTKSTTRFQARSGYLGRKENLFTLNHSPPPDVLLIDDMCTTGESLNQAHQLLSKHQSIPRCFTVGYHPLLLKQKSFQRWQLSKTSFLF